MTGHDDWLAEPYDRDPVWPCPECGGDEDGKNACVCDTVCDECGVHPEVGGPEWASGTKWCDDCSRADTALGPNDKESK
jgi:hypothetical protein